MLCGLKETELMLLLTIQNQVLQTAATGINLPANPVGILQYRGQSGPGGILFIPTAPGLLPHGSRSFRLDLGTIMYMHGGPASLHVQQVRLTGFMMVMERF